MNRTVFERYQIIFLTTAMLFPLLLLSLPARGDDAATLYKTKCAVCHAADGSGSSTMGKQLGAKDLRSDEVQKHPDAELNDNITNGMEKKMPAYKDKLSADQIKQLVAYIRSIAKKS